MKQRQLIFGPKTKMHAYQQKHTAAPFPLKIIQKYFSLKTIKNKKFKLPR